MARDNIIPLHRVTHLPSPRQQGGSPPARPANTLERIGNALGSDIGLRCYVSFLAGVLFAGGMFLLWSGIGL